MNPKRAAAARMRQLVTFAVAPRFDDVERRIDALTEQLRDPGYPTTRVEIDLFVLRQQMEECLDLLRIQHERVRDLCDRLEADPTPGSAGATNIQ